MVSVLHIYPDLPCIVFHSTIAAPRPRVPQNLLLASQGSTPRITPPGSPPSLSASVSPTRTSKPVSPRRHSVSFSTTRGMFDDRSSVFSSTSLTQASISTSDAGTGSQTGKYRSTRANTLYLRMFSFGRNFLLFE